MIQLAWAFSLWSWFLGDISASHSTVWTLQYLKVKLCERLWIWVLCQGRIVTKLVLGSDSAVDRQLFWSFKIFGYLLITKQERNSNPCLRSSELSLPYCCYCVFATLFGFHPKYCVQCSVKSDTTELPLMKHSLSTKVALPVSHSEY